MKKLLFVAILLSFPTLANSEEGTASSGFEQITVSSTAIGLTTSMFTLGSSSNTNPALFTKRVTCAVESNSIRFRTDGTNPTASVGYPVSSGSQIVLDNRSDIENFKAIRQSSDATLSCIYWR